MWPVHSEGPSEQKPIKNFREKGAWAYPGTAHFRAPIYLGRIAQVIFAIAQLSCSIYTLQQYADDTQLFLALSRDTVTTATVKLEQCLTSLHAWFCYNGLSLNGDESEALLLGRLLVVSISELSLLT